MENSSDPDPFGPNQRGVIDMDAYREKYGAPEAHDPETVGEGGTKVPDPKPEVEEDVPDGYVRRERLDEVRRQFRQQKMVEARAESRGSSFDRILERLR